MRIALTIAGSDSGAGAGVQADLKTFAVHNVYGVCAITALTAQNTLEVSQIFEVPIKILEAQIESLFADYAIDAVKTGMLLSSEIIEGVVRNLKDKSIPIVVDPIIDAGTGHPLLKESALDTLISQLIPIADIVIPNVMEAGKIAGLTLGTETDFRRAAEAIVSLGAKAVLIKGGHIISTKVQDFLYLKDGTHQIYEKVRYVDQDRHGSGCVLSAAITANLAKGFDILEAVKRAEAYIEKIFPDIVEVGHGVPPINPFYGVI